MLVVARARQSPKHSPTDPCHLLYKLTDFNVVKKKKKTKGVE